MVSACRFLVFLCVYKPRLSAIILWADGEVEPVAASVVTLYQEFVIVASGIVGDVEEDTCHTDGLLDAGTADVYGATCQVVGAFRASYEFVYLWRTVARINHETLYIRRGLVVLSEAQTVYGVVAVAQFL